MWNAANWRVAMEMRHGTTFAKATCTVLQDIPWLQELASFGNPVPALRATNHPNSKDARSRSRGPRETSTNGGKSKGNSGAKGASKGGKKGFVAIWFTKPAAMKDRAWRISPSWSGV